MFVQLTKYLLSYRQVNIPAIGAFKLVQIPANLNVSDKLISPPGSIIEYNTNESVQEHQISYLAASLQCDQASARIKLQEFADNLKYHLQKGPFQWKGLGTLELSEERINFFPAQQAIPVFQPVPAERVIRDRSPHTILAGDKDMLTTQDDTEIASRKKHKLMIIIGWVLILLSLAFIAFHFYKNGLKPSSSGNQMKIKIERSN